MHGSRAPFINETICELHRSVYAEVCGCLGLLLILSMYPEGGCLGAYTLLFKFQYIFHEFWILLSPRENCRKHMHSGDFTKTLLYCLLYYGTGEKCIGCTWESRETFSVCSWVTIQKMIQRHLYDQISKRLSHLGIDDKSPYITKMNDCIYKWIFWWWPWRWWNALIKFKLHK